MGITYHTLKYNTLPNHYIGDSKLETSERVTIRTHEPYRDLDMDPSGAPMIAFTEYTAYKKPAT